MPLIILQSLANFKMDNVYLSVYLAFFTFKHKRLFELDIYPDLKSLPCIKRESKKVI